MKQIPEPLQLALENRSLVLVVGAGFTAASVKAAGATSWVSLLKSALAKIIDLNGESNDKTNLIEQMISMAEGLGDTEILLNAAKLIRDDLSANGKSHFDTFLRDTFSQLKIESTSLAKAVKNLRCPVMTTNYDTLLSEALGNSNTRTWKDIKEMLKIIRNESPGVAHMHGIWDDADSVVFSSSDYDRIIGDENAIFNENGAYLMKTFLFIGMGEGVLDPHFTHLINQNKKYSGVASTVHYVLCNSNDLDKLKVRLSGTSMVPIEYGESYEDLPKFLNALHKGEAIDAIRSDLHVQAASSAWAKITNEINSNKLQVGDFESDSDVLDTLVSPTFLPMSHEQYVHEKRKTDRAAEGASNSKRLEPIQTSQVLSGNTVTVVVSEEHGGLTTALRWLCLEFSRSIGISTIPIVLDRLSMNSSDRLGTLVRRELLPLGLSVKRSERLPDIVLGIDNVSYRESEKFRTFCADIASLDAKKIFVGCSLGDESEIVSLLESKGITPQTVYLGKLGARDIQKYAVLISPTMGDVLIDRAQKLISREHLPRNPFTVSLVLALLLQAVSRPDKIQSQTDVLNEYMQLLLTHGSGNLDARETLSVSNLERVLTKLARKFVDERSGSLSEVTCVQVLQSLFDNLDWDESPSEWLRRLTQMRVLRSEGAQYSFRQSSYLYLYAAKAAVLDQKFMDSLLNDPLFFAPIIKHCAALQRDNAQLMKATQVLLSGWEKFEHSGTIFKSVPKIGVPDLDDSDENETSDNDSTIPDNDSEIESIESEEGDGDKEDAYDLSNDSDILPFPLHDLEKRTAAAQLSIAVNLASTVLRDSDAVEDKDSKDSALLATLHSWGVLMDLIETDVLIREGARQIVHEGVARGFISSEKADEIIPDIHRNYACLFVYSGISENLRSKKLAPSLERLFRSGDLKLRGEFAVSAATLFDLSSRYKGWTERLLSSADSLGDRWISTRFIALATQIIYVIDNFSSSDDENLLAAIDVQNSNKYSYENDRARRRYHEKFIKVLGSIRMRSRARQALVRQRGKRKIT